MALPGVPPAPAPAPAPASIPLAADADDWAAYADRQSLASRAAADSARMVAEMRDDLGDRWPGPPAKRRS